MRGHFHNLAFVGSSGPVFIVPARPFDRLHTIHAVPQVAWPIPTASSRITQKLLVNTTDLNHPVF